MSNEPKLVVERLTIALAGLAVVVLGFVTTAALVGLFAGLVLRVVDAVR